MEDLTFLRPFKADVDIIYQASNSDIIEDKRAYRKAYSNLSIKCKNEFDQLIKEESISSTAIQDATQKMKSGTKLMIVLAVLASIVYLLSLAVIIFPSFNNDEIGPIQMVIFFAILAVSMGLVFVLILIYVKNYEKLVKACCIVYTKNPLLGDPLMHPKFATRVLHSLESSPKRKQLITYRLTDHIVSVSRYEGRIELAIDNNVYAEKKAYASQSCLLEAYVFDTRIKYSLVSQGKNGFFVFLYINDELVIDSRSFNKLH